MSLIPALKSVELLRALLRAGFRIMRQSGSHIRLQHLNDSTRQISVPRHNSDIPRWLVREILRQAKIAPKELVKLLRK